MRRICIPMWLLIFIGFSAPAAAMPTLMESQGASVPSVIAPVVSDPVVLTYGIDRSAGNLASFIITTERATYYLEKSGGGLSSMLDSDGKDWIGFNNRKGSGWQGEYRGFPNAIHQQDGNYFHAMNSKTDPSSGTVTKQTPEHVQIEFVSENGNWIGVWDFYATHCNFTMRQVSPNYVYWIQYEGVAAGTMDDTDYWLSSADAEPMPITQNRSGDLPYPEWMAFGDNQSPRVLFMLNHTDDSHPDNYEHRPDMTVFAFGRAQKNKFLTTPATFSIGFIESTNYSQIQQNIRQVLAAQSPAARLDAQPAWIKITDFESDEPLQNWTKLDVQNETQPRIDNPQVTEVRSEAVLKNQYLLKKPAAEGVVGNRKAISFTALPKPIEVGDIYTFYVRLNVLAFPNNHMFGLSDMGPEGIAEHAYNALEPTLRITDRYDPNIDYKNDGTLLVRKDDWYQPIINPQTGTFATPLQTDTWYDVWMVVNNQPKSLGGQTYDLYIQGGEEFPSQQKVFTNADFRMQREQPLIYFSATCNTGPADKPYGNGGLGYDDLYMVAGVVLTKPAM